MFLAFAALLLLVVITVQNILYPPLQQETISDGLYGPYHWLLDGAYVVLASALALAFWGTGLPSEILSITAGTALMVTAFTNTFSTFVDKLKAGIHSKLHTWFTVVMFLSILSLEGFNDHGWFTWLSVAGVAAPVALVGVLKAVKSKILPGPAAEKLAVFLLCSWLAAWSLVKAFV